MKFMRSIIIFLLFFFPIYLSEQLTRKRKINDVSKIFLVISGSGEQSIFSDLFTSLPSEVIINGEKQNTISRKYTLSFPENNFTLKWNYLLNDCSNMFKSQSKIIKIDFSEFDSSNVENMYKMFSGCSKLKDINFTNFDTTKVTNMEYMFYECDSLISLDLSNFRTPNLKSTLYMFNDCDNLVSIDLSNFDTSKVTSMNSMFGWCVSLISVDLSNFDISLVTNMNYFFYKCRKLLFANLNSFEENTQISLDSMTDEVPSDFIYCINEEKSTKITNKLKTINSNNNCDNICFSKSIIIDMISRTCSLIQPECTQYLYNNECYEECPKRTSVSDDNDHLCIDLNCDKYYNYEQNRCIDEIEDGFFMNDTTLKTIDRCHSSCKTCEKKEIENNTNCKTCPNNKYFDSGKCLSSCTNGYYTDSLNNNICKCSANIKCKECSNESINNDLCISCNDGYFPKYNDLSNKFSFINCYNHLDGYFLDNDIYRQCYSNCKICNEYGDDNNHKCVECNDDYILIESNCYIKCPFYYHKFL